MHFRVDAVHRLELIHFVSGNLWLLREGGGCFGTSLGSHRHIGIAPSTTDRLPVLNTLQRDHTFHWKTWVLLATSFHLLSMLLSATGWSQLPRNLVNTIDNSSQVPQPTCYWKWHSWQLGNLTGSIAALVNGPKDSNMLLVFRLGAKSLQFS